MLCRELCELGRRRAAPAQDDERDPLGHGHENACAFPLGRADEPDGARRQTGGLERRAERLVDKHGHRAQRGAAGAQDGRVQALQQLTGDVEGDVRARLEVGADGPDRDAPFAHLEAVRERPRIDLALQRLDRRHGLDLGGQPLHPLVVEPQAVRGRLAVGRVGLEDLRAPLQHA